MEPSVNTVKHIVLWPQDKMS